MSRLTVRREARLPDPRRIDRFARAPELGPRILFFSGGTALRPLSRVLKRYTHNSIHLITPFDSGGSSAHLRRAFSMLSVGDLRNRMMALADETQAGNPAIYALFSHRLPERAPPAELRAILDAMIDGRDPLVVAVQRPLRAIIRTHLRCFRDGMPAGFDLRGASIGNLILAGGYLAQDGDIEAVIFLFANLVKVRGRVKPTAEADLQLRARLADGRVVVGQHLLTGKEVPALDSPIVELGTAVSADRPEPTAVAAPDHVVDEVARADLIVFPMGSFFTSVAASLLPTGLGEAVRRRACPKVYVPSTGIDPEVQGSSVFDSVRHLVELLRRDAGRDAPIEELLHAVILDQDDRAYPAPPEVDAIRDLGLQVVRPPLVEQPPDLDAQRLAEVLLSLC